MGGEVVTGSEQSTGELVFRYARRFNDELVTGEHMVGSPLGAWLLVALVAPLATGGTRTRLEQVLGTDADDACARASALLDRPHRPIASGAAAWSRDEFVLQRFRLWAETMPPLAQTGPLPTSEQASRWARDTSLGLIESFPLAIDAETAVVLATIVATRIEWDQPFNIVSSDELGGPFGGVVRTALKAPRRHRMFIARTDHTGDVGVHWASSADGLRVFSVIADAKVPPSAVAHAAHDIARSMCGRLVSSSARSLFELPLGVGHAWTIREETQIGNAGGNERFTAVLPAWTARSKHSLATNGAALGFDAVGDAVMAACHPDFPYQVTAVQAALASYSARGFEAAALTGVVFTGMAAGRPEPTTIRVADIRFNRPYAVVAMTTRSAPADGWNCMPVFSAWVTQPSDA
jgi:hypothetical protein